MNSSAIDSSDEEYDFDQSTLDYDEDPLAANNDPLIKPDPDGIAEVVDPIARNAFLEHENQRLLQELKTAHGKLSKMTSSVMKLFGPDQIEVLGRLTKLGYL